MRNLKKVIALVAVFAMLISTVAFAESFSDVAKTDNYAEAIETLSALNIITGDDENNDGKMEFRPADTITRAEVTAIISRIQGMNSAAQSNTEFTDVPSSHWASGYINQAAGQGIVNGYGDGNFGPEDAVKYEEIIKMLMETLGYNPFVNDNGGYPTGYITAAQRYGVLEGVVGGGVGTEAPRGMVAQMVYNAIDTPLMDKYTYGKDAQYVVYDNIDTYGYQTLLTRDLKMIKITGKVVANSYTDLTVPSTDVDTSMDKTIAVRVDNTNSNYQYGLSDYLATNDNNRSLSIYQGEVDADSYLGYAVSLYAKEESNNDEYTLVSITQNGSRNSSVEFTLDQYSSFDFTSASEKSTLKYLKNPSDRNETRLNIQANPTVIYNGVAGDTLDKYFTEGFIEEDTPYSGKISVMDTDDISGYDVVIIEVGVSAVVSEVNARGQVRFMTNINFPQVGSSRNAVLRELKFDDSDTNVLVNLTKGGEPFDYQELKAWDVLTITWNGVDDVYNARVLEAENTIVSTISSERATTSGGNEFNIDGTWYQEAANAYVTASLKPGTSGKFYIDEYGKIVALDKSVQPETSVGAPSDNYAYILNAAQELSTWQQSSVRVQLLDKSGEVYEAYLASSTKITNPSAEVLAAVGQTDTEEITVKMEDLEVDQSKALAKALTNNLVVYAGSSSGDIRTIIMAASFGTDNGDLEYATNTGAAGFAADYDEDTMTMGKVSINAETYVFYIKGSSDSANITYAGAGVADKDYSNVVRGDAVPERNFRNVVAFDIDDATDAARVVVIMNEDGGVSPAMNLAVIDSVGKSVDGNTDTVYSVDFYLNGELKTAVTKAEMSDKELTAIEGAKRGDLFKFTLAGDTITNAQALLIFDRGSDSKAYAKNENGIPAIDTLGTTGNSDEDYYFGAVTATTRSGNVTLSLYDKENKIFTEEISGKDNTAIVKEATGTNVYVYDPQLKDTVSLDLGGLGDAELYADELVTPGYTISGGDLKGSINTDDGYAYGMLDYVFARYYNNKAADIVVYKNYDFGNYNIIKND